MIPWIPLFFAFSYWTFRSKGASGTLGLSLGSALWAATTKQIRHVFVPGIGSYLYSTIFPFRRMEAFFLKASKASGLAVVRQSFVFSAVDLHGFAIRAIHIDISRFSAFWIDERSFDELSSTVACFAFFAPLPLAIGAENSPIFALLAWDFAGAFAQVAGDFIFCVRDSWSTGLKFFQISKWRCGAVLTPELPSRAMASP